jgi:hypothetical protein
MELEAVWYYLKQDMLRTCHELIWFRSKQTRLQTKLLLLISFIPGESTVDTHAKGDCVISSRSRRFN